MEMAELLAFIGLADYAEMPAGELSGGQRRLLALGRRHGGEAEAPDAG